MGTRETHASLTSIKEKPEKNASKTIDRLFSKLSKLYSQNLVKGYQMALETGVSQGLSKEL